MSDKTKASEKSKEGGTGDGAVTGELVKKGERTTDMVADQAAFLAGLGLEGGAGELQQTASGELTKWFDLRPMMADPTLYDQRCPADAKPRVGFAGILLGMAQMEVSADDNSGETIEDEDTGEVKRVRFFYFMRLESTCPVTWKNEKNEDMTEMAQPGDIIAVGERFAFKKWRTLPHDGTYRVIVQPVQRRRVKKDPKRFMWHFNVWEQALRVTPKVEVVATEPARRAVMGR